MRWGRDRFVKEARSFLLNTYGKPQCLLTKIWDAVLTPIRMFTTEPTVVCIACYMAYLFGIALRGFIEGDE